MNFRKFYTGKKSVFLAIVISALGVFAASKFVLPQNIFTSTPSGENTIRPITLVDGKNYYPGTYYASPVANGLKSYHSDRFGVSLNYSSDYVLFENLVKSDSQGQYSSTGGSIVMDLDLPVRESIARAEAGQGGGTSSGIVLTFFPKLDPSVSFLQWLRSNPNGNFNPADNPSVERTLTSTTIAGVPMFKYHSDIGMCSTDFAVFAFGKWFVMASSGDTEGSAGEKAKLDFKTVLDSIQVGQVQTYTNKSLGFSIDKPDDVYFMGEENNVVAFSLLPPSDPRQASSIGLVNALTITSVQIAPEEGKESKINGERVVISSIYGAYGGEKHWSYFFPDHNLLIQYVENKPIYEKMIGTIRFK